MLKIFVFILLNFSIGVYSQKAKGKGDEEVLRPAGAKFENPSFIRDRNRWIMKPEMPPMFTDPYKPVYNPAWMDYCDPYHCNDFHTEVCGLNRRKMKFRYFQSVCHIILNNQCSYYRGLIKYDMVELKHCRVYTMFLRMGCPTHCHHEELEPVCGTSVTRGHTVLFMNRCALTAANCRNITEYEYEEVDMKFCEQFLRLPSS